MWSIYCFTAVFSSLPQSGPVITILTTNRFRVDKYQKSQKLKNIQPLYATPVGTPFSDSAREGPRSDVPALPQPPPADPGGPVRPPPRSGV